MMWKQLKISLPEDLTKIALNKILASNPKNRARLVMMAQYPPFFCNPCPDPAVI